MKNRVFVVLVLWIIFACGPSNRSHPLDVPLVWTFKLDPDTLGVDQGWYETGFQVKSDQLVADLVDWDQFLEHPYDGIGWYFTDLTLDRVPERVALQFENADDRAKIWVNGQLAGQHTGAGMTFGIAVTPYLRRGSNRIAVRVTDFGGMGGLLHDVTLTTFKDSTDLYKGRFYSAKTATAPDWCEGAVLYEVNVRQFSQSGTFKGVADQLPRLKSLGVDIIWFMPISPIGEERKKGALGSPYSIRDYRAVNPALGTLDEFKTLVRQIHDLDMHVILDWVANHTAWDHPWINDHPEWYTQDATGDIVAPTEDWTDVADLNYDQEPLRERMIEAMSWWVKETDIDGFRCDVAEMVPYDFWNHATTTLQAIKPVLMLAEGEDPELHTVGFHMTYSSRLYGLLNRIAAGEAGVEAMADYFFHEQYRYPPDALRMRFSSNHDENSWKGAAPTRLGPANRALTALLFTIPGNPLIYNGQEIGLDRRLPFFYREPLEWHTSPYTEFYRDLVEVYDRFHDAGFEWSSRDSVFTVLRDKVSGRLWTVVNCSSRPQTMPVSVENPQQLTDLFTGESCPERGESLYLPPWDYRVYVAENE
jgi:hypothetical protein